MKNSRITSTHCCKHLLTAFTCLLLAACTGLGGSGPSSQVEPAKLRGHIEFLAADSLQGRNTGSVGYQVAADYVAAEFIKLGLAPGGNDGSYFQQVPLVEASLKKGTTRATVHTTEGDITLRYPQQYIMSADMHEASQATSAGLVFVGYGIVADEYGHDDYAGLDVQGKIVVMLAGRPHTWPSEEGAHLGSGPEKARHAAERGAVGRVTLHTPRDEKVNPFVKNFPYLGVPRMRWLRKDGLPDGYWPQLQAGAYFNLDAARHLFSGSSITLQQVYDADSTGAPLPRFELPTSLTLARESSHRMLSSPNVLGILPGSDPQLRNEYLVYSAHLDHLGVIKDDAAEDEIYNGAMDNAAGVAILLETARVLAAERDQLKRSVLFITVTGEEKGLLGAGYYANNPTLPIDSLVANINLDMPVLVFPFADVIAFGATHSSLKGTVAAAASRAGITLTPDPMPEQALFVRSDHYRFVQQGVPAVFLATGFTSKNKDQDGEALWQQFFQQHYHKASDQSDLPIDYASGAIFAEININIGREVCNTPGRPRWNEGDFFGRLFAPGD